MGVSGSRQFNFLLLLKGRRELDYAGVTVAGKKLHCFFVSLLSIKFANYILFLVLSVLWEHCFQKSVNSFENLFQEKRVY